MFLLGWSFIFHTWEGVVLFAKRCIIVQTMKMCHVQVKYGKCVTRMTRHKWLINIIFDWQSALSSAHPSPQTKNLQTDYRFPIPPSAEAGPGFPGGTATRKGDAHLLFGWNFPKAVWKWRKEDQGGPMSKNLCRSATGTGIAKLGPKKPGRGELGSATASNSVQFSFLYLQWCEYNLQ